MPYNSPPDVSANTATNVNNIDALMTHNRWKSKVVTFSFTDNFSNDYEPGYADSSTHSASFETLNAFQRAAFRNWATQYESVCGLDLNELTGADDRNATIRVAESNKYNTAFGYYPFKSNEGGDIWFNKTDYNSPTQGNFAYHTVGHELGHALGMTHGHELNGIRNVAMDANRDSMEYSIMTYRSYIGAAADYYKNEQWGYAQTLMMYDIASMQHQYGANYTYNSGDTTYTFSTTTGEMFVNGVGQGTPGGNRIFRTVWDGGGTDIYDLRNFTTNLLVDLRPGKYVDLHQGGDNQRAMLGTGEYAGGHIYNAMLHKNDSRSLIEGVYGGHGSDQFNGNRADNLLYGLAGNDTISGGAGNDLIDGGTGDDTMRGGTGDDTYVADSLSDILFEKANEGADIVYTYINAFTLGNNFETMVLGGTIFRGNGNELDNYLQGNNVNNYLWGKGGNDFLRGNAGNDILKGANGNDVLEGGLGADDMFGGLGNDWYYVDNSGDSLFEYSGGGIDHVSSTIDFTLMSNFENLTLTGTAYKGIGTNGGNFLYGNAANNFLRGLQGDDRLFGRGGNDTLRGDGGSDRMLGGTGSDLYIVHDVNDVVIEKLNEGTNDRVESYVNHTLTANVENLTLKGTAKRGIGNSLNNIINGNGANNFLFGKAGNNQLNGGNGSDTLNSGSGNDQMRGGMGNDTYNVNSAGDRVIESKNAGADQVLSTVNFTLGVNVENLRLNGSAIKGTGNVLSNRIDGNSKDNLLFGKSGADILKGMSGNDRIFGGKQNDILNGGTGNDYLNGTDQFGRGNNERDTLTGGGGGDRDTFVLGEKINGTSRVYYQGKGNLDRAVILDFDKRDSPAEKNFDVIQLAGNQTNYSLNNMSIGGDSGVGIKFNNDLLGFVKGYSANDLNLSNTSQFRFV